MKSGESLWQPNSLPKVVEGLFENEPTATEHFDSPHCQLTSFASLDSQ
jgi:hypothetical protein